MYSGSRNVPDYAIRGTEAYQLVTDHLGSLRRVVKLSDGAIMQRMDYGPFGEVSEHNAGLEAAAVWIRGWDLRQG